MKRIIIIGTLHAGFTPVSELEEVIKDYKPSQILVEICQNDVNREIISSYPEEMIFAYQWAKENNIPLSGFDSEIDPMKPGFRETDNQKVITQQKILMKKLSWKDMNREEYDKLLDIKALKNNVIPEKEKARESEMLENIKKSMLGEGTILIITGVGHLRFFEENLPEAFFPFRI